MNFEKALIWLQLLGILAAMVGIVWGVIWWFVRRDRIAASIEQKAFAGLDIYTAASPERVFVRFHTYYGFLVFVQQTEHRFIARPEDARIALWRLHKFNLIWGMFAYGALLIPFVSLVNYWLQLRSIRKQIQKTQALPG